VQQKRDAKSLVFMLIYDDIHRYCRKECFKRYPFVAARKWKFDQ